MVWGVQHWSQMQESENKHSEMVTKEADFADMNSMTRSKNELWIQGQRRCPLRKIGMYLPWRMTKIISESLEGMSNMMYENQVESKSQHVTFSGNTKWHKLYVAVTRKSLTMRTGHRMKIWNFGYMTHSFFILCYQMVNMLELETLRHQHLQRWDNDTDCGGKD